MSPVRYRLEFDVRDLPAVQFEVRRACSDLLRELAEAEAHPAARTALRAAADLFETGLPAEAARG